MIIVPPVNPLIGPPGMWSSSFMDICGLPGGGGTCFYVACCGACAYGEEVARLRSDEVCCGGNCCCAGCLFFCLGGFFPIFTTCIMCLPLPMSCSFLHHMFVRAAIRRKFGIEGSLCVDCLLTCFCTPCSICQETRELDRHGVLRSGQIQQAPVIIVAPGGYPQQTMQVQYPGQVPMAYPAQGGGMQQYPPQQQQMQMQPQYQPQQPYQQQYQQPPPIMGTPPPQQSPHKDSPKPAAA